MAERPDDLLDAIRLFAQKVAVLLELGLRLGSRSASDLRINELGEGLSSNMTILSEGAEWVMGQETSGIIGSLSSNLNPEGCPNESFARTHRTCHA